MKALIIRKYGGPEVLEWADMPAPAVTPGHLTIKVAAAGVNPIDWKIRAGEMKMFVRAPLPMILGAEVAGEVVEVGAGVTRFKPGDKVFSLIPGDHGGFAEIILAPESAAGLLPAKLDFVHGASLGVGAGTALQALRDRAELKAGQRVLINGASGAVGLYGVQIAKVLGAHVTAVCSAAKFDMVKAAGADDCIDYAKEDFAKSGKKWDVIFDSAGKKHFGDCRDALEAHGHYVTTISSGGDMVAPVLNPVRSQKSHFILLKPNAADTDYIRGLVDEGKLKTSVGATMPVQKMAEAQALGESGKANGKVVVTFG